MLESFLNVAFTYVLFDWVLIEVDVTIALIELALLTDKKIKFSDYITVQRLIVGRNWINNHPYRTCPLDYEKQMLGKKKRRKNLE